MWSEWFTSGMPSVTDYVQIEAEFYENNYKIEIMEGIVTRVMGYKVILAPDPGPGWGAIRWRKKIYPNEKIQIYETDQKLEEETC